MITQGNEWHLRMPAGLLIGLTLAMPIPLVASEDDHGSILPSEELLLFLAESIDVDGELLDPMTYLEQLNNESDGEEDNHSGSDRKDKKSLATFKEGISDEQ